MEEGIRISGNSLNWPINDIPYSEIIIRYICLIINIVDILRQYYLAIDLNSLLLVIIILY